MYVTNTAHHNFCWESPPSGQSHPTTFKPRLGGTNGCTLKPMESTWVISRVRMCEKWRIKWRNTIANVQQIKVLKCISGQVVSCKFSTMIINRQHREGGRIPGAVILNICALETCCPGNLILFSIKLHLLSNWWRGKLLQGCSWLIKRLVKLSVWLKYQHWFRCFFYKIRNRETNESIVDK